MKRIVCFGDSNTWGYEPASGQRFAENVRWTGVLASILGPDFRIIKEGLNARTTAFDDPVEGLHKNGRAYLLPCLESHAPLDLVIIMLGTNDLKQRFRLPASDIAEAAGSLVKMVHQSQAARCDQSRCPGSPSFGSGAGPGSETDPGGVIRSGCSLRTHTA